MTIKKFLKLFESEQVSEKAPPGAKAERMVKHIKKGYAKDGKLSDKEKSIAFATAWKQHNKEKMTEDVMLDEGGNALKHITNRFKHEVKNFMNSGYMADNLYDALYDYYLDTGEMPYGIAKARDGDPYAWVEERFYQDMGSGMSESAAVHEIAGDDTLNELARLAGLREGVAEAEKKPHPQTWHDVDKKLGKAVDKMSQAEKVKKGLAHPDTLKKKGVAEGSLNECGDMGMDTEDNFNVSTNMSSDGTKNVTISAQGDKAEALMQMLKLAGLGETDRPAMVMVSGGDDEIMDEAEKTRITKYSNTPDEEYETVAAITRQGNDLNREKRQYADKPKLGDNPMAESVLDADLDAMLESILLRDDLDSDFAKFTVVGTNPAGAEAKAIRSKKEPTPDMSTANLNYTDNEPMASSDGRVRVTYPPPKKQDPSVQELPLPPESPESRVTGPRELKVFGEPTGTEKYDDDAEVYEEGVWDTISNTIGDIVGTEGSALRRSEQLRQLDAMRQQYKGTEWEPQVEKRYQTHLGRIQADKGDVVDYDPKTGRETLRPVVPPEQWKGGK